MKPARVAVIGGGIAGLAAALRLRDRLGAATEIEVYEGAPAPGGKLRTGALAGVTAERGAEMFLMREPGGGGESSAVALAHRLGLALVHPAPVAPGLLVDAELRSLPGGTLLGVPADPATVSAVAAVDAAADAAGDRPLLAPGQDVTVGSLVRRRLGDEVVDRLVDPMLGGVYAGRADALSLATTMPGLAEACRSETTLTGAVRRALAAAPRPAGSPVFGAVRDGMGALVRALVSATAARLRLGLPVRELAPALGGGWRLVAGSARDPAVAEADALVLAVPAQPAARLLAGVQREAAAQVGMLDYASVALVTLALPAGTPLPERSGFLVPAAEGLMIKAATFMSRKWPHLPGGAELVRLSVGRFGEPGPLRMTDRELARQAGRELAAAVAADLPAPLAWHVQRWGGSLPQYAPGHLARVAAARGALPPTLRLAGAAYDGVGIPACIRSGQTAADEVALALEQSTV